MGAHDHVVGWLDRFRNHVARRSYTPNEQIVNFSNGDLYSTPSLRRVNENAFSTCNTHRSISPAISHPTPRFHNLIQNPYLPSPDFALGLSLYLLLVLLSYRWTIPLHNNPSICDVYHLLFNCSKSSSKRVHLNSLLNSSNFPFDTKHIFSSQQPLSVLSFFNHSGFPV